MDAVFRAIDDPSRRLLLDALFEQDGQTLGALVERLPRMTRYGVMSHLRVLEAAQLVTTRKEGRHKYHYLNPVPIRLIHDRWIGKYAEPRVGAIADLAVRLERGARPMSRPVHVYKAYIRATPEDVWDAMTNGDRTVQYFYGTRVESDWEPGSSIVYYGGDGSVVADGEIVSADAPKRLELTFLARWDPELEAEGPVREVWAIAEVNGMSELTIELYDTTTDSATYRDFVEGFPYIVSGLKSLLETGSALPPPS